MTPRTAPLDLEGLKELATKATPGPWEVSEGEPPTRDRTRMGTWHYWVQTVDKIEGYSKRFIAWLTGSMGDSDIIERRPEMKRDNPEARADAEYIAAANPASILSLLERLERAEDALRRVLRRSARVVSGNLEATAFSVADYDVQVTSEVLGAKFCGTGHCADPDANYWGLIVDGERCWLCGTELVESEPSV